MSASKLEYVLMVPGWQRTWPRRRSLFFTPFSIMPHWSPASPVSSVLWNISMPATAAFWGLSFTPTISMPSPALTTPRSMRPVATVPFPEMDMTLSTAMRKGLSTALAGSGMKESTAFMSSWIAGTPYSPVSPLRAFSAEPLMKGVSSPGNWYMSNISLTSSSTRSTSSMSSTMSILFKKTTSLGIPTWRERRMCSRVCGIGPSYPDTTRIAPSIWAAPVIMFLT
mmetsp:Transcript_93868/g.265578  ORF Transcript_93868/g.265578 Transcript_93868/m.265578 type:complete len:225 (-) Transcript_93868:400-1074(-)